METADGNDLEPPPHWDKNVTVSWVVTRIRDISAAAETFSIDAYLDINWKDERLRGISKTFLREMANNKQLWVPRLEITNSRACEVVSNEATLVGTEGEITYKYRIRAELDCDLNLAKFPFDTQYLRFNLESMSYDVSQVILQPGECNIAAPSVYNVTGWKLMNDGLVNVSLQHYPGMCLHPFSRIEACFVLKRVPDFWVKRNIVILSALMLLMLTAFAIPANTDHIGDRLSIAMTLALTIVAFQSVVADTMPQIPYLTSLDKFFMLSFALTTITAIQSSVLFFLTHRMNIISVEDSNWYDILSGTLLISMSICSTIYMIFFTDEEADDNCYKKQANMVEEDKDYEKVDRRRSPRLIQKLKRRRARSSSRNSNSYG